MEEISQSLETQLNNWGKKSIISKAQLILQLIEYLTLNAINNYEK